MKLTEKRLLRAIGEADEQMVEKAAPKLLPADLEMLRDFVPEQTEAPAPQRGRIIRRITEIGVLCAAVALCVFAGIGLVKLKRSAAGSNLRKKGGIDEARAFLASFAEIVKKGDTQEILAESLIGKMCELIPDTYDDPPEEFAEWYTEQWSKSFRIEDGEDEYDDIVSCRQMISDRIEYISMKYTKNGEPEKAEEFRKAEQPYLDLFESIEEAYCFDIICGTEEEPVSDDIEVFCIGGKWYAEPLDYIIPGLSEEARAELEEYRKQDEKSEEKPEEEPTETEAEAASPLNFEIREDGAYVWGCSKDAESVRIPEKYQGVPVVGIECQAFCECSQLKEITIPETVAQVRFSAFKDTPWLEQQRAKDPLVIVNGILVDGRTAKGDITIPDGVHAIAEYAFSDSTYDYAEDWRKEGAFNDGLTSVTLPSSVTEINRGAFLNCIALKSINLPEGLTKIDADVFVRCDLKELTIPSSVRSIEIRAFQFSSLKKVVLPDGLQRVATDAFMGCTNLAEISIPESVNDFGHSVFESTPWITQQQAENLCVVVNHILLDGSACGDSAVIPDGVVRINEEAFRNNRSTTSVFIPDTVTSIGEEAFFRCKRLKSATIPGSVKLLDDRSFYECAEMTEVTLLDGVKTIGEQAFFGCTKLNTVTIPESLEEIGGYVFTDTAWLNQKRNESPLVIVNGILVDGVNCSGSITIPDSVKTIAPCAFEENEHLTDVTIPDGFTAINDGIFRLCSQLQNVSIPDSVTEIGEGAFYRCSSLKSIILPDGVESIGVGAFENCVSLSDLELSRNLKSIGNMAFMGCDSLKTLTMPDSVTDIAWNAFNDGVIIHGKAGSYAETYAKENGIPFVAE